MKMLRRTILWCMCLAMLALGACASSTGTTVAWKNYPHLWKAPFQNRPFLFIKCRLSDVPTIPAGFDTAINNFTTIAGLGTGNLVDYYSDISYGAVSLYGDRVVGWVNAPFSTKTYPGRAAGVTACANAVPEGQVDFSSFYGVVIITNALIGGGACYVGQQNLTIHGQSYPLACVVFDTGSLWTWFGAHEIGHGLGMPHSFDTTGDICQGGSLPGEYEDPWDMMSSMCTRAFLNPNFPNTGPDSNPGDASAGPGMNLPNLIHMGWVASTRLASYTAFQAPQTFKLAALSHPTARGNLGVLILPNPKTPGYYYTVEYRQRDGWDAGIPNNGVMINYFKAKDAGPNTPYSFLFRNKSNPDEDGDWLTGEGWLDPTHTIQVCVTSIDPVSNTATVQIGVPTPFCASGPRVKILSPADGSSVTAGQSFTLSASATDNLGQPLPDQKVIWRADSKLLGSGKSLTTHIDTPGSYKITVTGTDSSGASASDSITLQVVAQSATPPAKPTVQIISPTPGQSYSLGSGDTSLTIALSAQGSSGVVSYSWSDSLGVISSKQANETLVVNLPFSITPCGATNDTIVVKAMDNHGQTATASVKITINRYCIN